MKTTKTTLYDEHIPLFTKIHLMFLERHHQERGKIFRFAEKIQYKNSFSGSGSAVSEAAHAEKPEYLPHPRSQPAAPFLIFSVF